MNMLSGSLEEVTIELLDIAPMTEYEVYMRQFGVMGTGQQASQTHEDACEIAIQTEPEDAETTWTQFPPEDLVGWGREVTKEKEEKEESLGTLSYLNINSARLSKFIRSVSPVICSLLQENMLSSRKSGESDFGVSKTFKSYNEFSSSYMQIPSTLSFLAGREIKHVSFSTIQEKVSVSEVPLIVTTYGKYSSSSKKGSSTDVSRNQNSTLSNDDQFKVEFLKNRWEYESPSFLRTKNFICIWDYLFDPHRPKYILISDCTPVCASFSTHNHNCAVFAGTEEGIVQVWDLRERESLHKRVTIGGVEYIIRRCSFSTESLGASKLLENKGLTTHQAPIVKLFPVNIQCESKDASTDIEGALEETGLDEDKYSLKNHKGFRSFQICSLSDDGLLNVWIAVELSGQSEESIDSEYGLTPGSRIKLVLSSSVFVDRRSQKLKTDMSGIADVDVNIRAFDVSLLPHDVNQYFVTTDVGVILHGLKFGAASSPKEYLYTKSIAGHAQIMSINSISFSPFLTEYFLVGLSNGEAALFKTSCPEPICFFEHFTSTAASECNVSRLNSVVEVFWSSSRPAVFYAIDDKGIVYGWDLLHSTQTPRHISDSAQKKKFEEKGVKQMKKLAQMTSLAQSEPLKDANKDPQVHMCVGYDNGAVEIHLINSEMAVPKDTELEEIRVLLQTIR